MKKNNKKMPSKKMPMKEPMTEKEMGGVMNKTSGKKVSKKNKKSK